MEQTFEATDINVGHHPEGYRIDRTASPMDRYTRWRITPDGRWVDPTPVCFDSMPQEGWLKSERFNWDAVEGAERGP
jgi:hypothetical protein